MLRFEGMTVHAAVSQFVQFIRHQGELALSTDLCAIASLTVVPAQCLQLVVQAFHSVFLNLVSVSDCSGVVTTRTH